MMDVQNLILRIIASINSKEFYIQDILVCQYLVKLAPLHM